MRFFSTSFGTILGAFIVCLLIPEFAHAATASTASVLSPNFHIISDACNCTSPASAPGWGCVLATFQNLIDFLVGFTTIIITVFIALAGFTYMTSGGSPEKRSLANTRILNAVIGLLIVLCSWLIVDSIMKVVYNPNSFFGPWNSILGPTVGSDCLVARALPNGLPALFSAANATGGPAINAQSPVAPATAPASGSCSATALQSDWQSPQVAATLACIINNESRCQNVLNKTIPGQNPSSAGGRYQVLATTGPKGQSVLGTLPACAAIDGGVNCDLYFHNGSGDGSPQAQACNQAQLDPTCNTQVAQYLYKSGGYSAWLGAGDVGGKNQACVNTYSGT